MNTKKTVRLFRKEPENSRRFCCITAYDAVTAALADEAQMDLILVGDSVGMTVLGYDSTVPVTLDDIIHHCAAVRRGAPNGFVVADMPFMSYQTGIRDAMINAAQAVREGGADAVKLEGGIEMAETIRALTGAGLPVLAHIGLLPQQVLAKGGYFLRGKTTHDIESLKEDLEAVTEAGAFAVVMEGIVPEVAETLTQASKIPTIGIAAGDDCDGQIQVVNDVIGLNVRPLPRHAKNFGDASALIRNALEAYKKSIC